MSSILKVDQLQDSSGNNIINESSNTITIGKSGDTVNLASGATAGFGKILQVVQASNSTQTDTSSSSFTDIVTGSITPSNTSSKILFVAHANGLYSSTNGAFGKVQVVHSSGTTVVSGTVPHGSNSTVGVGSASISYLDSPSSTSAVTYKIQFNCPYTPGGSVRINTGSAMSTITLMEIAG